MNYLVSAILCILIFVAFQQEAYSVCVSCQCTMSSIFAHIVWVSFVVSMRRNAITVEV